MSALLTSLTALSQQIINIDTGATLPLTSFSQPERSKQYVEDGTIVTYTFDNMRIDSVIVTGRTAFVPSISGFGQLHELGEPNLPCSFDIINIPTDCEIAISVEEYEYSDYFFEVAPVELPEFDSTQLNQSEENTIKTRGFYPAEIVSLVDVEESTKGRFAYIKITPIVYDHENKTLRVANKIAYKLTYSTNRLNPRKLRTSTNSITDNQKSNVYDGEIELPGNYLIISTSEFKKAIVQFAYWKRTLGYNVFTSYNDNWGSNSSVKDTIDYYFNKYNGLQHILFVGDNNIVPSNYDSSLSVDNKGTVGVTDYYYGCISNNHTYTKNPDAICGRIPAKTAQQATNAFNKIIAYELCEGMYSSDFFKQNIFMAQFQDLDEQGTEDRNFVYTSEQIIDALLRNNGSPIRLYNATQYNSAKPQTYRNGQPLPSHLTSDSFNWHANNSDISAALNKGSSYVLYRGHGAPEFWSHPCYHASDIKSECRYKYNFLNTISENVQPLIFSVACATGRFETPNCFATTSITQEHGGSSCIIAATCDTGSAMNDCFALGMMDAFLPEAVISENIKDRTVTEVYEPVFRIGNIMQQGSLRALEKYSMVGNVKAYHCFGDPSMMIRSCKPQPFYNARITLDDDTKICSVTTGEGPAFISFFDTNNGNIKCVYADSAQFQFSDIHYESHGRPYQLYGKENVAIYAPNRIPVISFCWPLRVPDDITKLQLCTITKDYIVIKLSCTYSSNDIVFIQISNALTGAPISQHECTNTTDAQNIDVSSLPPGTYVVSLIINGKIIDSVKVTK